MSKKKNFQEDINSYTLKTKAVEDLVAASKDNTPEYSREELSKYKTKSKLHIPGPVKAVFVKFWFGGMVCYFFMWGLGLYISSQLDLFVVTSIALGFVTDILVNNIFRFYAETEGSNDKWMMFPKKGYKSLVFNVVYAFVLMLFVAKAYNLINTVILAITGQVDTVPFGVEPISFGLIYLGFDMLFISLKRLAKKIVLDAKRKEDLSCHI